MEAYSGARFKYNLKLVKRDIPSTIGKLAINANNAGGVVFGISSNVLADT